MNTTAPRPTENAAIGRCPRNPLPNRNINELRRLWRAAVARRDRHGARLFDLMLRRLVGAEVAW